ncbi:uncharacterized protein [Penaeus vannamei]|uniref:uncharacterized protein n=1 Tax=Penaeus vannamei TaxID=6689 RepID=UPI00387F8B5A
MALVNTYSKKEEHRITHKNGGRAIQVDYLLCWRPNLREIGDCKKWDTQWDEERKVEYKRQKKIYKAYEELYDRLDSKEGERDLCRLAEQRHRAGKDIQVRVMKDKKGNILISEESVLKRWKFSETQRRSEVVEIVNRDIEHINKEKGEMAIGILLRMFNKIMEGVKMPIARKKGVLEPIFKNKCEEIITEA